MSTAAAAGANSAQADAHATSVTAALTARVFKRSPLGQVKVDASPCEAFSPARRGSKRGRGCDTFGAGNL